MFFVSHRILLFSRHFARDKFSLHTVEIEEIYSHAKETLEKISRFSTMQCSITIFEEKFREINFLPNELILRNIFQARVENYSCTVRNFHHFTAT